MPGGFTHGTRSSEVETQIKGFLAVKNPVVIIGTAPINQGNLENVNKITLIQTTTDAAVEFGGAANLPGFTISEALYVGLQIFPTRPIIVVNVLDPNEHSVTENLEDIPVLNKTINLSRVGIIKESLEVKNAANSIAIDDYTATFKTDGTLNIKLAETLNVTAVDVEYVYLDPSLVTEADIIGSINPDTLERKGLELLHDIFPKYSMIPSYVITPGYNSNALRAILDTKASIINDKWGSMSIFDIPDDTAYGSAIEFKKTNNWIDADQIVNYGVTKFGGEYFHTSIFAAFLSASVDASNDGIPYESPSNKNIKAEGIAYKVGNVYKDLNLDEPEANLLNENGICTILSRANGIVYWGNRTSVFQPGGNMDPKDMWIPIKRMFKYIANTVMLNTEIDVDKPMTYSKAKNIKMNINIYLASLVSDEKLLGASVDFLEIDNPIGDLVQGKFKWHLFLGGVIPGETLEYILEYEGKYLTGFYAA